MFVTLSSLSSHCHPPTGRDPLELAGEIVATITDQDLMIGPEVWEWACQGFSGCVWIW